MIRPESPWPIRAAVAGLAPAAIVALGASFLLSTKPGPRVVHAPAKPVPLAQRTTASLKAELGPPAGTFPGDAIQLPGAVCDAWGDEAHARVNIICVASAGEGQTS